MVDLRLVPLESTFSGYFKTRKLSCYEYHLNIFRAVSSFHVVQSHWNKNERLPFSNDGVVCHSPDSAIGGNGSSRQREKTVWQLRRNFSRMFRSFDRSNIGIRALSPVLTSLLQYALSQCRSNSID
ncbi:hypothetical protein NPIL_304041 [Nephila pilipes]|uniref:Uncharacterized protein n=1 Tax=Nephila pilipes TaxID=299642 RepID=A0A8X6NRZ7_NEPPI|nr:hypothetical protein NPIL_304041 [Nephila pilipes]